MFKSLLPISDQILSIWSYELAPGNIGSPKYISANTHPKDQISIFYEYGLNPKRASGDRTGIVYM